MEILKFEKITDEKWLNLFAATFRHNDHQGRWVFASRRPDPQRQADACDAVVIVPILKEPGQPNRLVLEKEFRVPAGGYVIGFPAGLLEPGEGVEETVRREMIEETGLEVTAFKKITPPLYSSSGLSDETAAMAYVDVRVNPALAAGLEGSEDIEVLLLDYAAVCRMCDAPDGPIDAKAWTALYLYLQLGKLE